MDALTKALSLAEIGCHVFPVRITEDSSKVPCLPKRDGGNGHLDATDDVEQIAQWFQNEYPDAHVGVHTGRSGLNVLDRDRKYDEAGNVTKDGFLSLEEEWLFPPETFHYPSASGKGQHDIYLAPENAVLNGQADYRKLPGVDRRAGSSWILWAGDTVPASRDAFAPAPEWLNDPAVIRTGNSFEGTVDEWVDSLVQGEPNVLVRKAIERIPADMAHSEMVERQYNAVRLGAEGNPGVTHLFDAIKQAWTTRPEENHTTPRDQWAYKFEEALMSGIQKYGASVERIETLPDFNITSLSQKINTALLTGQPQDKHHFSKVLNALQDVELSDEEKASVLWNAPTTKALAREWGIDFVYQRIESSRHVPEPERENPRLEEAQERGFNGKLSLLTEEERAYIAKRPTFVQTYMEAAKRAGIDNETYAWQSAWTVASMAFAFRGFIKQSAEQIMGVNLMGIGLGESGTGKTTALNFQNAALDRLFEGDNEDKDPYRTGSDNSPQGLHTHLLNRDRKPTLLFQDEASIFFKSVQTKNWMEELTHAVSDWYGGKVNASSKLTLKEMRGKSALTSFHMSMMGTPKMLFSLLTDDLFQTGFLARVVWVVAPEPTEDEKKRQYLTREYDGQDDAGIGESSTIVEDLVTDLISAGRMLGGKPQRIRTPYEEQVRTQQAFEAMGEYIEGHAKQDILEPSVTRLGADALRKCAAICAMYRGDTVVSKADTLHAIAAVEVWFNHLLEVADRVAQGAFQNLCNDIEAYIHRAKTATETKVLNAFSNRIQKDPRELEVALRHLVNTGRVNKDEEGGRAPKYSINGGRV